MFAFSSQIDNNGAMLKVNCVWFILAGCWAGLGGGLGAGASAWLRGGLGWLIRMALLWVALMFVWPSAWASWPLIGDQAGDHFLLTYKGTLNGRAVTMVAELPNRWPKAIQMQTPLYRQAVLFFDDYPSPILLSSEYAQSQQGVYGGYLSAEWRASTDCESHAKVVWQIDGGAVSPRFLSEFTAMDYQRLQGEWRGWLLDEDYHEVSQALYAQPMQDGALSQPIPEPVYTLDLRLHDAQRGNLGWVDYPGPMFCSINNFEGKLNCDFDKNPARAQAQRAMRAQRDAWVAGDWTALSEAVAYPFVVYAVDRAAAPTIVLRTPEALVEYFQQHGGDAADAAWPVDIAYWHSANWQQDAAVFELGQQLWFNAAGQMSAMATAPLSEGAQPLPWVNAVLPPKPEEAWLVDAMQMGEECMALTATHGLCSQGGGAVGGSVAGFVARSGKTKRKRWNIVYLQAVNKSVRRQGLSATWLSSRADVEAIALTPYGADQQLLALWFRYAEVPSIVASKPLPGEINRVGHELVRGFAPLEVACLAFADRGVVPVDCEIGHHERVVCSTPRGGGMTRCEVMQQRRLASD